MADPLAIIQDYEQGGFKRPAGITEDELTNRLARASRTLRGELPELDRNIAARLVDPTLVSDVVCEIVEASFPVDGAPAGLESMQIGAGPFQETHRFSNPRGDMYVTGKHKRLLTPQRRRRAFTVVPKIGRL